MGAEDNVRARSEELIRNSTDFRLREELPTEKRWACNSREALYAVGLSRVLCN